MKEPYKRQTAALWPSSAICVGLLFPSRPGGLITEITWKEGNIICLHGQYRLCATLRGIRSISDEWLNCICERISAASEKAELADYRFNCTNTTAQSLISTVSMMGQCILLLVTLLVAAAGATPAGAVLSVGNLAGSFFNGAGHLYGLLWQ